MLLPRPDLLGFGLYLMRKTYPLGCDCKIPSPTDLSLCKDVRFLHLFIHLTFPFLTRFNSFAFCGSRFTARKRISFLDNLVEAGHMIGKAAESC